MIRDVTLSKFITVPRILSYKPFKCIKLVLNKDHIVSYEENETNPNSTILATTRETIHINIPFNSLDRMFPHDEIMMKDYDYDT